MGHYLKSTLYLFICLLTVSNTFAQSPPEKGVDIINELILSDSINGAQSEISKQILALKSAKNFDSLVSYVLPLGRIEIRSKNSIESAKTLADAINQNNSSLATQSKLNIELSKLYFELGEPAAAFDLAGEAHALAQKVSDEELLINSEYYLGDYALRTGNIEALETHIRSANDRILAKKGEPYTITARVLNLMGGVMFFSTKQDSAQYYFESALQYIPNLEDNVESKLYLPAAIYGNLFLINLNKGEHVKASKYEEESQRLNQKFLKKAPNHPQATRVKRNLVLGYVNLSSLHFDLGDYDRSDNILVLAYDFAQKNFDSNQDEYFYVTLGMAEVKIAKREFTKALHFLKESERCLDGMTKDNEQLRAYLYNDFGNHAYETNALEKALEYYEESDSHYEKFNPGEYDSNRLYQSMNMGIIYAELGFKEKAIGKVNKAYNYILKENGPDTYQTNLLINSLAKVNYELKEYQEVLKWCEKSLKIYNDKSFSKGYDKLYFEEKKAEIVLLNTQAKYYLATKKDTTLLHNLVAQLDEGIQILEARKSVISSAESVNILLENNKEIFDFDKKLNLELFVKTNDSRYLNKAISLHESALYNKIRVRLNINDAIAFSNIPQPVLARENELRKALNIDPEQATEDTLNKLLDAKKKWNTFLDSLQTTYPKYHKMRYATIGKSLENIQEQIDKGTTAVRYFFADERLYAYVISKENEKLIPLDYADVKKLIADLGENQSDVVATANNLHTLYNKLWKPLETVINTKNVIIFPDGALYNLSFETLTPTKIETFKALCTQSLLAKHTISYNYSLYLLAPDTNSKIYENSFVGFAPEFNDGMKEDYKIAISDTLQIDRAYLKLLQQPFNVNLAKSFGENFNGDYFINQNSTEQIFKQNASEHKIIHIGTHAESNNVSPELSRLIFAKDVSQASSEDGSLYTYEIYNTSLNANLAILTACETGKPTYQPGEGMISLAHAFNYAGSESILTSLWKVDERSSAEIIESFYGYIKLGKPKDEALQLAKLDYIKNTEGRTLAPQYWAGLVLMGDTNPINVADATNWLYWILGILALILLGIFLKNKACTP
ncbi:CHAT domain-containing protein [Maribacter sp. R77961]|uniref:CHAT domain-containing protein n=1 Tax=Maribacter sp. R77961 TaxID=3093871 RepID=UPI0037C5931C